MKRQFKLLTLLVLLVSFLLSNGMPSYAAKAKENNVDITKVISGKIKEGSKSYDFDVAYKTDIYMVSYLGNSSKDNELLSDDYKIIIYNKKKQVVAKSKMSTFYDEKNKSLTVYQTIDKKLPKGIYKLEVNLQQGVSYKNPQSYKIYTDSEIYGGLVKIISVKAKTKTSHVRTNVSISTKAKGEYLQYQYSVIDSKTNKEVIIRKFNRNQKVTWKPAKAGTYKVKVYVKNVKSNKLSTKTMNYKVLKK
ncbi:hypothetical protein [Viridibacillus arvi]|uniref:hypothetical protein n=1 Tax=Viridibacillus arvi TaxID=263475 RepID=UPI0034CD4F5E